MCESLNQPSVACIILNWNGWEDTIACIGSVRKSGYDNFSILVIDNASTNDSVARIQTSYPGLEIIQNAENLGFGRGNNIGIEIALRRGFEYIWLLNNDTTVEPQTLPELVLHARSNPNFGQIGSTLLYAHNPSQIQAWGGGRINLWTGVNRHFTKPVAQENIDYITAASVLIPVKALKKIGLFDPGYFMYCEDADLSIRMRLAGWQLGVAASARVLHKEGGSSGVKNPIFERWVSASTVRFLIKFAPFPPIPIAIFIGGRAAKRLLAGEWRRAWCVLAGLTGSYFHKKR